MADALAAPVGARWHRVALQVNPYGYHGRSAPKTKFSDEQSYNEAIVGACRQRNIELIAITDHWCVRTAEGLAYARVGRHRRTPRLWWRGVRKAGDSYTLLKVLPHDEAYDWAGRRRVSVNRATGVIEVRDVAALEERLPQLTDHAETATSRLLDGVGDADLTRLGIDDQVLPFARALTDLDQLESARGILPEPQYDVLLGLAVGMAPEQVWQEMMGTQAVTADYDTSDVGARSTQRVVLVSGPDELMEVFSYPFALWRVYLHPAQHRLAYGSFSGATRVTGGPGTGKTVVALHRAKHLAESASRDRSVLLTTFTKTLTGSLEDGLRLLIDEVALLRRVDIRNIDQIAYQITSAQHGRLPVLQPSDERALWKRLISRFDLSCTETFLGQEWRHVALAQGITTPEVYLAASRAGRGHPLRTRERQEIWQAIAGFDDELRARGWWTYETICVEAARLLALADTKPYRHIIVDEAQDLSPWQWRMLRAAVVPDRDDIFLVGDTHQRIYDHRVSLRQVGIDIAGRSERLKLNYRTTAEILGWSLGLLRGEHIDDMNEDLESLAGCRSEVHGTAPVLHGASTRAAEMEHLAGVVRGWLDDGVEPGQIGVGARSGTLVDEAVGALVHTGVPAVSLDQTRGAGQRGRRRHHAPDERTGAPLRRPDRSRSAPRTSPLRGYPGRSGSTLARPRSPARTVPALRRLHSCPGEAHNFVAWHPEPPVALWITREWHSVP
ncbi:MAG: UvrD-helicase domain-containing protein [Pseudonocardiaceae bacterium]